MNNPQRTQRRPQRSNPQRSNPQRSGHPRAPRAPRAPQTQVTPRTPRDQELLDQYHRDQLEFDRAQDALTAAKTCVDDARAAAVAAEIKLGNAARSTRAGALVCARTGYDTAQRELTQVEKVFEHYLRVFNTTKFDAGRSEEALDAGRSEKALTAK